MKVLVADDDPVSRRFIEVSLVRWGYEVVVACDGLEAMQVLSEADAPRLVVLDWLMPGLDGVQICRAIRQQKSQTYTYILLLTSKRGKGEVVEGLESGADDYIRKPFAPAELKVRLRAGERILDLLRQLADAHDAVRELSIHDALTGLYNRAGILELLEVELDRARRQATPLGLALVDLDRFKSVNDTYGHLVGDDVLKAVANTFTGSLRPYDSIGRYGGEELLIVLPGCDEVNAVGQAERLRATLMQRALPTSRGDLNVTGSFGVVAIDGKAGIDARQLLEAADIALYLAKDNGRNRVELGNITSQVIAR